MTTAAGVFFYSTSTDRFLYLLRSDSLTWSVPGGKLEAGESISDALFRECIEEIGYWPPSVKLVPLQLFTNRNFQYHSFFCAVSSEFTPHLNHEHVGYSWIRPGIYPKPLHPGLFNTVNFDTVQDKLRMLIQSLVKQSFDGIEAHGTENNSSTH
jgi:8-oxo-dGTP pyrophosphatase MutT (NUDIX family)